MSAVRDPAQAQRQVLPGVRGQDGLMSRTCRFTFGDRSGAAEWIYDGEHLTLTPEEGGVLSVALKELAGVSSDGYTLDLVVPAGPLGGAAPMDAESPAAGAAAAARAAGAVGALADAAGTLGRPAAAGAADHLVLTRLGADGPTLLEALRREWLAARAEVLRLGGSGEGKRFYGRVAGPAPTGAPATCGAEPFQALLFEEVLVVARNGHDLQPVFLALTEGVAFDEPSYSTRLRCWPNQEIVFSKLAGQTDEFLQAVQANRALLTKESAAQLAAALPGLPAGARAALAGIWLPGRLMQLEAMDALCPGFASGFNDGWLPRLPRCDEGRHLLSWVEKMGGGAWLGFTRDDAGVSGGDEEPSETDPGSSSGDSPPESGGPSESAPGGSAARVPGDVPDGAYAAAPEGDGQVLPAGAQPVWVLACLGEAWFLEALSVGDRATYYFKGGEEVPFLVSQLLCAPQFSREALYNRLEQLTGDSASLAIPAMYLGFLAELRKRFAGRVIHQGAEGWRKGVDQLAAKPG
jgi:hypothetical protein